MQVLENIRFIRQLKGWSQEDMAEKLDMSLNGYGSIERGDTDVQLSRLEKIANTFEISLLQLFNLNEKSIFNQTNNTSESNVQSQYYWNDSPKDKQQLEHELEKMLLLNTQQEIGHLTNEIIYLKEIIELMKNKNGSLDS